jgi:ADP-ribosylglycohydrolase
MPERPSCIGRLDQRLRSRYRGCLFGGAVGDALGAPVEFLKLSEIEARFGRGRIRDYAPAYGRLGAITDDTQMTLFTAEGLLRGWVRGMDRGICSLEAVVANAYQRWLLTQGYTAPALFGEKSSGWLVGHPELHHRRAPGNTCLDALRTKRHFEDPAQNDSKGCGGVMRAAPVGLFEAHWLPGPEDEELEEAFRLGVQTAAVTHGHPTGQLPAGVLACTVALLAKGASLREALARAKAELVKNPRYEETLEALEAAEALARSRPARAEAIRALGGGWVAEEALAIAVYAALSAETFEAGVILAVNHDGDSDSTGSIAGNLLGALHGVESIPARWLETLELRGVIEEVADDLATVREWKDGREDPEEWGYWWERYPGY